MTSAIAHADCPGRAKFSIADGIAAIDDAVTVAATVRTAPWDQMPGLFQADGEDVDEEGFSWNRNGRWESLNVVNANDRFFSLYYTVSWYGARAAHPNHHFETFNYAIQNDSLYRLDLVDFFANYREALNDISSICKREIEREYWRRDGRGPGPRHRNWIATGCAPDGDAPFSAFAARSDGFKFLFSPYEVGPYALSSWTVEIAYYDLLKHLRPAGPHTWAMGSHRVA